MKKNRWYDKYSELSELIEKIKDLDDNDRNKVLLNIKDIIMKDDPDLIDKNVMKFPMSLKRRWYDKDPYSWLIINALKFCNENLLKKVTKYLKKEIG